VESPPSLFAKLLGADRAGDAASRILSALLASPTVPIGAYVAEPASFLHALDPRVKQAWLVALLLLPGALVLPAKAAVAAALALLSMLALPPRVWAPQLRGLAALSLLVFAFSALGADAVPPLTQPRLPAGALEALPSLSPSAPYSYRLFTLGPLAATRRGAAFAASAALLAFSALQAAHLALCTTPPEALAHALAWWLTPLRSSHAPAWLATAADELVLTLLLALRFCALAFEAARNLALGAATRGVDWSALGPLGGAATAVLLARRLAAELGDTCSRVADAMRARGYAHPSQAQAALVVRDGPASPRARSHASPCSTRRRSSYAGATAWRCCCWRHC
jgi:energy-coupling factor transport system permease protein